MPAYRRRSAPQRPIRAEEFFSSPSSSIRLFGERGDAGFGARALLCHHLVETPTKILQHDGSGITPRPARDRAAGMRGRAGLVETRDRHAMLRPAGSRPQGASLRRVLGAAVTRTLPVVRIAPFQIERAL